MIGSKIRGHCNAIGLTFIVLNTAIGRMKEFYDIYYLATTFDFDGKKLQEAIYETLTNRARLYEKDSTL